MKRSIIYLTLTIGPLFAQVDYYTQVQSIFNDNCISCHINGGAYYGGLDLVNYDSLMVGSHSGAVVIPGDHASSILWQEISSGDMPPGNSNDLSTEEIELIAQWIDEGALQQNNNSYSIEGRWLWGYGGFTSTPSTMYEFLDGLRYTYYCTENNGCDSTYWNSLDTSDAIPNPDLYTFINDTLTIDGSSGSFVDFECDGNIILSGDDIVLWRVGLDTSDCENQGLGFSNIINTPEKFKLNQNYPNPFNPVTSLSYDLLEDSYVRITIYDMLGNVINQLVNEVQNSGFKSVQWNGTNNQGKPVSAGVYLYSIEAGNLRQIKKMVLLK